MPRLDLPMADKNLCSKTENFETSFSLTIQPEPQLNFIRLLSRWAGDDASGYTHEFQVNVLSGDQEPTDLLQSCASVSSARSIQIMHSGYGITWALRNSGELRISFVDSIWQIYVENQLLGLLMDENSRLPEGMRVPHIFATKIDHWSQISGAQELETLFVLHTAEIRSLEGISTESPKKLWALILCEASGLESVDGVERLGLEILHIRYSKKLQQIRSLASQAKLVELNLRDTAVTDISSLAKLRSISHLDLGGLMIEDLAPISDLTDLKYLDASWVNICDAAALAKLSNLAYLDLSMCMRLQDISDLRDIRCLNTLKLSASEITSLHGIESCTELEILMANHTDIVSLTPLAKATEMRELDIRNTLVRDLTPIQHLDKLRKLHCNTDIFAGNKWPSLKQHASGGFSSPAETLRNKMRERPGYSTFTSAHV